MMLVALLMLVALWLLLTRTRIGLVIQAALTHPEMVEALGHNVPRVFMLVFGSGCALAGAGRRDRRHHLRHRAGDGGDRSARSSSWSWWSAAWARWPAPSSRSLLIGLLQTLPLTVDWSLADAAADCSAASVAPRATSAGRCCSITLSQVAPILPYLLLVLILIFRPQGPARHAGRLTMAGDVYDSSPGTSAAGSSGSPFALVLLVAPLLWRSELRADDAVADGHRDHRLPGLQHPARPGRHAELRPRRLQRPGLVPRDPRAEPGRRRASWPSR